MKLIKYENLGDLMIPFSEVLNIRDLSKITIRYSKCIFLASCLGYIYNGFVSYIAVSHFRVDQRFIPFLTTECETSVSLLESSRCLLRLHRTINTKAS